jgi:hypothetical protein
MGTVHNLVDSRQSSQTKRFRWSEAENGFYLNDTDTGLTRYIGTGVDMFCASPEEGVENRDCLKPGTQQFYDALNSYFENEQSTIAETYFGWIIGKVEPDTKVATQHTVGATHTYLKRRAALHAEAVKADLVAMMSMPMSLIKFLGCDISHKLQEAVKLGNIQSFGDLGDVMDHNMLGDGDNVLGELTTLLNPNNEDDDLKRQAVLDVFNDAFEIVDLWIKADGLKEVLCRDFTTLRT